MMATLSRLLGEGVPGGWDRSTAGKASVLAAAEKNKTPRSYWDWAPYVTSNKTGFFPYTPAVNLFYALDAALDAAVTAR